MDGTAPYFLQQIPAMMSVHEGDPLMLQCIVDGDPKPRGLFMDFVINVKFILAEKYKSLIL